MPDSERDIMTPFDPEQFGFVRLRDFEIPGGVAVHEYKNHPAVDGNRDFLRLNLYLTKDGSYVTIWNGLLEPIFTEGELTDGRLKSVERPSDLGFLRDYGQDLFRGHIDSAEAAVYILTALRVGGPGQQYALPQVLTAGHDNTLRCEMLALATDCRRPLPNV
jgi:hypothetical protein